MFIIKRNIFFYLIFVTQISFGQTDEDSLKNRKHNEYCIPQIPGIKKTKGFEFNCLTAQDYTIISNINDTLTLGHIDYDYKITVKAKIPLVLRDDIKLIMGLKFDGDKIIFSDNLSSNNTFYNSLNKKRLKSYGTSFNLVKSFIGNRYILGRASFRLSGDFKKEELDDYFRSSLSVIYGIRAREDLSWGVGVSYGYSFGRQYVFPVFVYSRKFTEKWSLNAFLPVKITLGYKINDKNTIDLVNEIKGDSYNIRIDDFDPNNLFLERSNLLTKITYEREIYDFLWFGLSMGNRFNIAFDLSEKNTFLNRNTPQVTNELKNAIFYQASIFLVPPKKWRNK